MILSKPDYIKIYGHRGARGVLPENTLESFKYLFENNIYAYETDILISKDFIPVITHDFRLDPSYTKDINDNWIEDENIKIIDLTYDQILQFDVGTLNKLSKYCRKFVNQKSLQNQKIPKLSELLKLTSDNIVEDLLINLEIKSTPIEKNLTPEPDEMVKIIIDEVSRSNLEDRIIYYSFDWRVLREIKERDSKIHRAYIKSGARGKIYDKSQWLDFTPLHNGVELPELIKALGGSAWHPNYKDVNKEIVQISHDKGLPVNVWTVNRESDMLRMIDYGVDGMMTDYPLKLKEICKRENIKWF